MESGESSVVKPIEGTEYRDIIREQPNVVVDVHASWCAPCKVYSPIFHEVAKKFLYVNFYSADLDYSFELGTQYGITSVPTTLFFLNGQLVLTAPGAMSAETLAAKLVAVYHPPSGL